MTKQKMTPTDLSECRPGNLQRSKFSQLTQIFSSSSSSSSSNFPAFEDEDEDDLVVASAGLCFNRHSDFGFRISCLFLLVSLLCLGGCQTATQSLFTATGPGWRVQQGQALWRPLRGLPEFGGDLVLASDKAGRHLIQFDKTPIAILSAQPTSNRWWINFPQRSQSFSGSGRGSTRFGWLYLTPALEGQTLPKNFHFERKPDGGWRLENSRTGETLEGFLSP